MNIPTHSDETKKAVSALRHPSRLGLLNARALLSPVTSNTITIDLTELVDAEVRIYHFSDGVVYFQADARVDDVNGDTHEVVIATTTNRAECLDAVVNFCKQFV